MQKSAKIALIAVVAVILVGGVGFYWFFLRSDNPPEVTLRDRAGEPTTAPAGPARSSADGTWTVHQDPKVFVGYRVTELFAGETIKKEAVGRTLGVTGTMKVAGQQVTDVDITADMTRLESDQSRRDNFIKNQGLQTARFTTATFKTTAPIQLPSAPVQGQKMTVDATGDLTLHGQTKRVTVPLEAVWNGATIDVSGKLDVTLADFGIEKINVPSVSVDTEGKLEVSLTFVPSAAAEAGSGSGR